MLPYLLVLLLSWRWARFGAAQVLLGIAALISSAPTPFFPYDAFIANHGSTNALVLLFLPVYPLVVVVPLCFAAWWTARQARSQR